VPTDHPLAWTLRSIARLERDGKVRGPRLTEPGHERWQRIAGRLGMADFIALLHEDLAAAFPVPFDLDAWRTPPIPALTEERAAALVREALTEDATTPQGFLRGACRALGLPAGGDIADLPKVQPHQRAVELPGAGGRIGLQQALDSQVALERNLVFVADTDEERVAVGLAVVECRSNPPAVWTSTEFAAAVARGERFDHVFGVRGHASVEALVARTGVEVRWT
jgi:hypothetical protein